MRYIVSDIHGCFDQYRALLEKIQFSDEDELYVLEDGGRVTAEQFRKLAAFCVETEEVIYVDGLQ